MSYTALYRKFRPAGFEDVKGQDAIVTTLKNQIKSGRIGHAYLFCGTRGTGKTSIAKIFAKAVNCEHPEDGSPCNQCTMCSTINNQTSMNVIEIDAASNNGVDNIREIIDEVQYSPTEGKYKVYIIDEVHMLSAGAFNALLKTLEEPPAYVIFILATTEVHKIPITILSRCQRYDFKRITIDVISDRLMELMKKEGIDAEEKAVRYVAKAADGSMRDALSLLDQCTAFYFGEKLSYDNVLEVLGAVDTGVFQRLLEHVLSRSVNGCVELLDEIILAGRDLGQFVVDFTWYLRNLLIIKTSEEDTAGGMIDMSSENLEQLKEESQNIEVDSLMRYIRIFSDLSGQIKYASAKRVLVEIALIKLCVPAMESNSDSVLDRIRVLEEKMEKGAAAFQSTEASVIPEETAAGEEEKKEIPEAVPEDLKEVAKNWNKILPKVSGSVRAYLDCAKPCAGGENILILSFEDELTKDLLNEKHCEEIEAVIEKTIGKKVKVRTRLTEKKGDSGSDLPDLSKLFKMEVEYED